MIFYIDGSGFNGIKSRCMVVDELGKIRQQQEFNESFTNNEMEYKALECALNIANMNDEIKTDSQLLVGHVTKNWKVNVPHLLPYVTKCRELVKQKNIKLDWVPREENIAGVLLERSKT